MLFPSQKPSQSQNLTKAWYYHFLKILLLIKNNQKIPPHRHFPPRKSRTNPSKKPSQSPNRTRASSHLPRLIRTVSLHPETWVIRPMSLRRAKQQASTQSSPSPSNAFSGPLWSGRRHKNTAGLSCSCVFRSRLFLLCGRFCGDCVAFFRLRWSWEPFEYVGFIRRMVWVLWLVCGQCGDLLLCGQDVKVSWMVIIIIFLFIYLFLGVKWIVVRYILWMY